LDPPRLRVQTPLYRRGSGYRLGGNLASCWLLRGRVLGIILCPALTIMLYKAPFPLDRHLGGICPPFCLGSCRGEGSLIADWLSSVMTFVTPVLASVALVGASPLSVKQPLEGFCLHHPALDLLGGVASRLLAQPALQAKPVFLS
jgi:hypothetical protein